jgi:hypothetical protein
LWMQGIRLIGSLPSDPTSATSATACLYASSFLKQLDGENNSAYFKRLSQVASDPVAFEKMVMEDDVTAAPKAVKVVKNKKDSATKQNKNKNNSTPTSTQTSMDDTEKRQRGYERPEDWEAEQEAEKGLLSWDEKVQFDGQRDGNRFQQNEILRRNINMFH